MQGNRTDQEIKILVAYAPLEERLDDTGVAVHGATEKVLIDPLLADRAQSDRAKLVCGELPVGLEPAQSEANEVALGSQFAILPAILLGVDELCIDEFAHSANAPVLGTDNFLALQSCVDDPLRILRLLFASRLQTLLKSLPIPLELNLPDAVSEIDAGHEDTPKVA